MAATSTSKASASLSLKEYLKRYENPSEEKKKKSKKKKSKNPTKPGLTPAVQVFDEDPVWQKPVNLEEEGKDSDSAEEQPQIDEDIEVKRMKRLEAIRSRRPYGAISEDGSGWISVSDASRESKAGIEAPDLSPPCQGQVHIGAHSPEPGPHALDSVGEDDDILPPQYLQLHPSTSSPDLKRDNQGRHDSPDLSPPRRGFRLSPGQDHKPSASPYVKRRRHDMRAISPPQRGRHHSPELDMKPSGPVSMNSDLSLSHHSRQQMDLLDFRRKSSERQDLQDFSLARHPRLSAKTSPKVAGRHDSPDLSPPRRSRRHSTPSDSTGKDLEGPKSLDLSPPRRSHPPTLDLKRNNSERPESQDLSPPRRGRRHSPEIDTSHAPSKKDLSPPRRERHLSSIKEGRVSGLFSKREFKEETERKKKEISGFPEMDPLVSGRGAEPVYRDKLSGRRVSKEEFLKPQQGEEKPKEKKLEWGKGLAQKREAEEREHELELERDRPFARSRDDPELDKMLKERIRWGDPMAHLVKRKQPGLVLEDLGDGEKMEESGFIIPQDIPGHSWIRRGIDAAPNRYGIRPGRHWDGVDRSNGYEKELFKRQNEKRATEREAYLWSVSDM